LRTSGARRTLLLREDDLRGLIQLDEAVEELRRAYLGVAAGDGASAPRVRLPAPGDRTLHALVAVAPPLGIAGAKLTLAGTGRPAALTLLYGLQEGRPLALVQSAELSLLRTVATSVLAARHLARPGSRRLAVLGSGRQATGQLRGFCAAFPIASASVWSPTAAHRLALAALAREELDVECEAAGTAERAVAGADIVVTATRASEPVLRAEWVPVGAHVSAIGADRAQRRELDGRLVALACRVVTDSLEQARRDAGDLLGAVREGAIGWERVVELSALVAGTAPGRRHDSEITVFDAQGTALGDVALAGLAYRRALEAGRGSALEL
jgi:ornithine cyclodeaminase/alanine dehydrogenase-like protein (mu-crystallin family)